MLDYLEVKRFYANKLANDAEGNGLVESAEYHTHKMVYLKGVEDGMKAVGLDYAEVKRLIAMVG